MYVRGRGLGQDCSAGSGSACSWYDNVWATEGCLDWYAACAPTDPFYVLNTKGLIVGGSQVLGSTAASAIQAGTGIPVWGWAVGLGALGIILLPELLKR